MAINFSFWENDYFFDSIDFCIIGAGIVGLSTGLRLADLFPKSKIVIIDGGIYSNGASTKNAGFACFGSMSEIAEDLNHHSEEEIIDLIRLRWQGLKRLLDTTGKKDIEYHKTGAREIFRNDEKATFESLENSRKRVNQLVKEATGIEESFEVRPLETNFNAFEKCFYNKYEGQLHPVKMVHKLRQLAKKKDIILLNGAVIDHLDSENRILHVNDRGSFRPRNIILCTNAFARDLLPEIEVKPARNQVMITTPIVNLNWKGNFHCDRGYMYFRDYRNRLLIGGARNIDEGNEQTAEFGNTETILTYLHGFINSVLLPDINYTIETQWSGIIGIGNKKQPIIRQINEGIYAGVRMGGMGVAIGSTVGHKLAELIFRTEHNTQG